MKIYVSEFISLWLIRGSYPQDISGFGYTGTSSNLDDLLMCDTWWFYAAIKCQLCMQ